MEKEQRTYQIFEHRHAAILENINQNCGIARISSLSPLRSVSTFSLRNRAARGGGGPFPFIRFRWRNAFILVLTPGFKKERYYISAARRLRLSGAVMRALLARLHSQAHVTRAHVNMRVHIFVRVCAVIPSIPAFSSPTHRSRRRMKEGIKGRQSEAPRRRYIAPGNE